METAREALQEDRIDPFELFSEAIRDDVRGLAYVGHVEAPVAFCGHTFVLRTLHPSEEAAAAVAARPWVGTQVEQEVWANATVALALTSVDGDAAFCPQVGPDINAYAAQRLRYVADEWFQPVLDYLYAHYVALKTRAWRAMQELQDLSTGGRGTSRPSPDS